MMAVQNLEILKRDFKEILSKQENEEMEIELLRRTYERYFRIRIECQRYGYDSFLDLLIDMKPDIIIENDIAKLNCYRTVTVANAQNGNLKRNENNNRNGINRYQARSNIYDSINWVLKLENFSENTTEDELKDLLMSYKIMKLIIRRNVPNHDPPRFALVEIENYDEACEIFTCIDGMNFKGKNIRVQFDRSSISRNQHWDRGKKKIGKFRNERANEWAIPKRNFRENSVQSFSLNHKTKNEQCSGEFPNRKENKCPFLWTEPCQEQDQPFLCHKITGSNSLNIEEQPSLKSLKISNNNENENLNSICMEPGQIQKMFDDTLVPRFGGIEKFPSILEICFHDKSTQAFRWVLVTNETNLDLLEELLESLMKLQQQDLLPAPMKCNRVTKKSNGLWSRAWIMKDIDEEKAQIFYLDFGNTEVVSKSDLFILPDKFWTIFPLALPLYCEAFKDEARQPKDGNGLILMVKLVGKYDEFVYRAEIIQKKDR